MLHFLKAFKPIFADFVATIVFIALYAITGSIYAAIPLGIAAGILQIAWLKYRGSPVSTMQWASLALVIVLGGASLFTHDARFVMIKPSIGSFAIGCVMLSSNWLDRYLPEIVKRECEQALYAGMEPRLGHLSFPAGGGQPLCGLHDGPESLGVVQRHRADDGTDRSLFDSVRCNAIRRAPPRPGAHRSGRTARIGRRRFLKARRLPPLYRCRTHPASATTLSISCAGCGWLWLTTSRRCG